MIVNYRESYWQRYWRNIIADIQKNIILGNEKELPISVRRKTDVTENYHYFFQNMNQ